MCNSSLKHESIIYYSCRVVQVRLFRAVKKDCISGEPASPIADSCKCSERIKTDYNSYLCTLCRLIVKNINNLYENRAISTGYGFVFKKLKEVNKKEDIKMSEALPILNDIPVNKMAASMFWKTPEWAQVPSEVKLGVIEARMKPEEINIDYFKPPAKRPRHEVQPADHRGEKFYFKETDYEGNIIVDGVCMVVGFAEQRRKKGTGYYGGAKPKYWQGEWDNKIKHGRYHNLKKWWCLMPDKTYRAFNWATISKRVKAYEGK